MDGWLLLVWFFGVSVHTCVCMRVTSKRYEDFALLPVYEYYFTGLLLEWSALCQRPSLKWMPSSSKDAVFSQ